MTTPKPTVMMRRALAIFRRPSSSFEHRVIEAQVSHQEAADAQVHGLATTGAGADQRAAALVREAQRPESDGGRAITPREAKPIMEQILASAAADESIARHTA